MAAVTQRANQRPAFSLLTNQKPGQMARGRSQWHWPDYWDISCHENTRLWLVSVGNNSLSLVNTDTWLIFSIPGWHFTTNLRRTQHRFQSLAVCHDQYLEQFSKSMSAQVELISGPAESWWQAKHFEEMGINSLGSIFVAHFVVRGDNIPWKL